MIVILTQPIQSQNSNVKIKSKAPPLPFFQLILAKPTINNFASKRITTDFNED